MPIANIKQLSVHFQADKQLITAVDDVSFDLNAGETLALLGESGCGKSLTSLALMRLLPPYGVYGHASEVLISSQDLLTLPEQVMRGFRGRRLAMIFQEPMTALNPVLSVGEQLAEALRFNLGAESSSVKQRMLDLLQEVQMPDPAKRLDLYPHQLSGGQKQRVVIAMALAGEPDVLIADEPTTALDVTIQAQILTLLKSIQKRRSMSLLLITHDLGVVKEMADRVCVMYAGQVVENASADDFFQQPLHPYSQQLFESIPTFAKRGQHLQSIKGQVPTLDNMPSGCRYHPRCAHVFAPCAENKPDLQCIQSRQVRCHLYPEHQKPPELSVACQQWQTKDIEKEATLSVNNLSVHFIEKHSWFESKREWFKAVDGISFQLDKGKTLAIVGESGCGKTTMARAIMRLQPITSGEILYLGERVDSLYGASLRAFRKNVQIIFQDPFSSMNPRMTVADIIAEGMKAQGFSSAQIKKKQIALLDRVNLPKNSLQRYPHQFSGGQRQRICIARALALEPNVLICDEPTSALDVSVQAQILNLLKELQQEQGLSYLFITHNMGVVSYIADDVLVMRSGKAVESGACHEVFHNPSKPYTKALLDSVLTI